MFVPPPIEQVKAMKDKRFVFAFCQCFLPCDNFTSSNTNKLERERHTGDGPLRVVGHDSGCDASQPWVYI
jgi:hypothetical protein